MPLPKVNEWPDKVRHAGTTGGFNLLRDLIPSLQEAIPDLKNFEGGLFVEEDLKNVRPMCWVHLDSGHLDEKIINDFNTTIGLRYGIVIDANGHLKVGDNFIMIMPKKYRERIAAERKAALDRQNALSHQKSAYVHPSDPNYGEMMQGAQEVADAASTKYKVQVAGEPEPAEKPKRGRPRKS